MPTKRMHISLKHGLSYCSVYPVNYAISGVHLLSRLQILAARSSALAAI